MRTLQEHIDDLDRMVDNGAEKSNIRSQIAFIAREVTALESDYVRLAEVHTKLQEAHQILDAKHSAFEKKQRDAGWNAIKKKADEHQRILRSHELKDI